MSETARRSATWDDLSRTRWLRFGAWTDGDAPRVAPFDAIELDVAGLFLPLSP